MSPEKTPAGIVSAEQLARLLMISPTRVRQLVAAGAIPRLGRDSYPLVGAVQGYMKWLLDEGRRASKSASAQRVTNARAEEVEKRVAARLEALVPADDMRGVIGVIMATVEGEVGKLHETAPASIRDAVKADAAAMMERLHKARQRAEDKIALDK